ncbi:MAG: hypothetical protein WAL59_29715, partial [Roseiarcus sp.]
MPSFPAVGSSATCRGSISQPAEAPNSLVVGKNAGISSNRPFSGKPVSKKFAIQAFATSIPYAAEPEQGINPHFSNYLCAPLFT